MTPFISFAWHLTTARRRNAWACCALALCWQMCAINDLWPRLSVCLFQDVETVYRTAAETSPLPVFPTATRRTCTASGESQSRQAKRWKYQTDWQICLIMCSFLSFNELLAAASHQRWYERSGPISFSHSATDKVILYVIRAWRKSVTLPEGPQSYWWGRVYKQTA